MKANKQGISLIVLVITIVVVIILAAAVILSLGNNNPINNARIANFAQTKDGISSAVYSYTGSVQGKTQGYFTDDQIILGSVAKDDDATDPIPKKGSTGYRIVKGAYGADDADEAIIDDVKDVNGTAVTDVLYELDATNFKKNIGEALPSTPVANSKWAINSDGQVFLVFAAKDNIPTWMGYDKKASDPLEEAKSNATIASGVYYIEAGA